ncbi:hypothetical protein ACQPW3_06220 [Actinosynnema sp. CA-248983]
MKARLAAVAVALLLLPGTASAADSPLPTMNIESGAATLCLTSDAKRKLDDMGVALTAIAPATDTTTEDGRSCVRLPITGRMKLDLSEVAVRLGGGLRFHRAADDTELRFQNLHTVPRDGKIVMVATPGDRDEEVELFGAAASDVTVEPTAVPVGAQLKAALPTAADLAHELEQAFDEESFAPGAELFAATAEVVLVNPVDVLGAVLEV